MPLTAKNCAHDRPYNKIFDRSRFACGAGRPEARGAPAHHLGRRRPIAPDDRRPFYMFLRTILIDFYDEYLVLSLSIENKIGGGP
jgi:hypothetical protein